MWPSGATPTIVSISEPRVEGTAITVTGAASDPAGARDTLSYAWTVLKDSVAFVSGSGTTFAFTPDDNASYEIGLTVSDGDGGSIDVSQTISVANVAPTLTLSGLTSGEEGATYTLNLSSSDPGADTISGWTIAWGDGNVETVSDSPSSVMHVYEYGLNIYTISATATDEDGVFAADNEVILTVSNVAPVFSPLDTIILAADEDLSTVAWFSDPGNETWTATVDYGDGDGAVNIAVNPDHSLSLNHDYSDRGVYSVTVTVNDGDSGEDSAQFLVVFDSPVIMAQPGETQIGVFVDDLDLVVTQGGSDLYRGLLGDTRGLLILGNSESEQFVIDIPGLTSGALPTGIWLVAGEAAMGGDNDDLTLTDSGTPPTVLTNSDYTTGGSEAGTIAMDALTVHFFEFEPITDSLHVLNRTFSIGTAGEVNIAMTDGIGVSTIADPTTHAFESITFTAPANPLTIKGGTGDITIDVSESAQPVSITGGSGHNIIIARGGNPVTINEGDTFQLVSDIADAQADWGDGTSSLAREGHVYVNEGTYEARVATTDGEVVTDVTVRNIIPRVDLGPDHNITEGQAVTIRGLFTDPGGDTWSATVDFGDGSEIQSLTLTKAFELSHTYADDGIYNVTVGVADGIATGSGLAIVTVRNVAPTPEIVSLSEPQVEGTAITVTGAASDPAVRSTHSATAGPSSRAARHLSAAAARRSPSLRMTTPATTSV